MSLPTDVYDGRGRSRGRIPDRHFEQEDPRQEYLRPAPRRGTPEREPPSDLEDIRNLLTPPESKFTFEFSMRPVDVKEYLDRFVIGQEHAKKVLSNGVCYHFRRIAREIAQEETAQASAKDAHDDAGVKHVRAGIPREDDARVHRVKKNVLLIGNTGVGKTYMVDKISRLAGVPFVKADMTKFSATGYVGGDVESTIQDLYVKADGIAKLAEIGIVYLDEFDKIASYSMSIGKDVNGLEVQRTLLKLLEETEVKLNGQRGRETVINTRNVLFVCSGAFPGLEQIVRTRLGTSTDWRPYITGQDLVDFGLEAELVGRLPVRAALHDLTASDLYAILRESKDSAIRQYREDLAEYGIDLEFTDGALKAIADRAALAKTGARALVGTIEEFLTEFMYALPSTDITSFTVDEQTVAKPTHALKKLIGNQAPSR